MQFKGRLRAPGDVSEGVAVDLRLDDIFLELNSQDMTLGRWRMDDVEAERVQSNHFHLTIAGEQMQFLADDALAFAYEGLDVIEQIGSRLRKKRRGLLGLRRGTHESPRAEEDLNEAEQPASVTGSPISLEAVEEASPPAPAIKPVRVLEEPVPAPSISVAPPEAEPEQEEVASRPSEDLEEVLREPEPAEPAVEPAAIDEGAAVTAIFTAEEETGTASWAVEVEAIDLGALFAEEVERSSLHSRKPDEIPATKEIDLRVASEMPEPPGEVDLRSVEAVAPAANGRSHGSRRGFFSRRPRITDHDHDFRVSKTVGGLTRRVCAICGHVSFEGEDVYQGWS